LIYELKSTARSQLQSQREKKDTNKYADENKQTRKIPKQLISSKLKHKLLTIVIMVIQFIFRMLAKNFVLLQANAEIRKYKDKIRNK
jgi:cell division protein FtsL